MKRFIQVLAVSLTFLALSTAYGAPTPGFRVERLVPEEATVKLGQPGRFGPLVIPGTLLKVVHRNDILLFSDPRTMQPLGQAPCRKAALRQWVSKASVQTLRKVRGKKTRLYMTYRYGKSQCTATGWIDPTARRAKEVVLKEGVRTRPQVAGIPEEKSEAELLFRGVDRYISSVVHCASKAEKYRWKTGEPKLAKCACPIVDSWRLPKVKKPVRISMKILNFKMGVSLTVTKQGRTQDCKPWTARTPPEGEPAFLESLLKKM
jgi:hypothetical protein